MSKEFAGSCRVAEKTMDLPSGVKEEGRSLLEWKVTRVGDPPRAGMV
ncbi:MAG: hypothetical protein ACON38_05430 [Akkermansiaceae bacterium]